ncbi:MAG: TonB-dependent receptor plug domain-containing protein [Bacteroidetes bacterium]|nr:TonB-dependent receptor plug domain-containing protein [Bacteroidota bacterium]
MRHFKGIVPLLLLLIQTAVLNGQTAENNPVNYDNMSLEELMNVKITVASIKELTPRQSPGIITYITAEEIRNSGARDLMEVLRQVPGFEFGSDVEGVVGIGIRGNWAHEGKVVLFFDGIELNESLYSTLQFGNHYPIDNIERIEIIRGPGSALHGGFAAYAVINIITKSAQIGKLEVGGHVSQSTTYNGIARSSSNLYFSKKGEKAGFSIKVNGNQSLRSHQIYTDVYGKSYDMSQQSQLKNFFVNASGNIGKLQLRFLSDNYRLNGRDGYVEIKEQASPNLFTAHNFEAKYEINANDNFKIIPRFVISKQYPWSTPKKTAETDEEAFRIQTLGLLGSINFVNDISEKFNLISGVSMRRDVSTNEIAGEIFNTTGTSQFINENISLFSQALYTTKWFNLVSGIRFNYNSRYNNAIVPRIGITREFKSSHFKALFSRAFRAPSTQNIDLGDHIKPEFTDVIELEAGVKITKDAYITFNAFHMKTIDPIVYYVTPTTNEDAYTNLSNTGTSGLEFVFQYKKKWGGIDINGSYYDSEDGTDVNLYTPTTNDNVHIGLAQFKSNASIHFLITPDLQIGTNLNYLSSRYGVSHVDVNDESSIYTLYPAFYLLNIHLEYRFKK